MNSDYWEFSIIMFDNGVRLEWTIQMYWKYIDLSSIDILDTMEFTLPAEKAEMDFFSQLKRHIMLAMFWRISRHKEEEGENYKRLYHIDTLALSERTRNALIKNGILYVEDLRKMKRIEIHLLEWIWKVALDEIEKALEQFTS